MEFSTYIPITVIAVVIIVLAVFYISSNKKSVHTELYDEGVKNENDGAYAIALQNYEDALKEIGQESKLKDQIVQRIKTIKFTLEYENRFHKAVPPVK